MPIFSQTIRDLGFSTLNRKEGVVSNSAPAFPDDLGGSISAGDLRRILPSQGIDLQSLKITTRVNTWEQSYKNVQGDYLVKEGESWVRKNPHIGFVISNEADARLFFHPDYFANNQFQALEAEFYMNGNDTPDPVGFAFGFDNNINNTTNSGIVVFFDPNISMVTVYSRVTGTWTVEKQDAFAFVVGRWYSCKAIMYANNTAPWLRIFVDGQQITSVSNADYTPPQKDGYLGFVVNAPNAGKIRNFKVGTVNEIYGDLVVSGTITADKISVSQLSAISADLGTITAGTVTGATIQTSALANTGIKFTSTAITGYDGVGAEKFKLEASNGNITVNGGTFTGGTFQTSSSANTGIKFTSTAITGFDSSNKESFSINATTGKVTAKDIEVASGKIFIASFLAPDESGANAMVGNGDNTATPSVAQYLDGAISLYSHLTYLASSLRNQTKNGTGATNTASMLGACYNGNAGFFYRSFAGGNVLERLNNGAAAIAWTATIGSLIGAGQYGVDTDGTRVWIAGTNGGPTFHLFNMVFSTGAANGQSANNADLSSVFGVIYWNSNVWVFSSNGGVSKILKYDTANTPVIVSTTTLGDDSFRGLRIFRLDNTGRVYCLAEGAYSTTSRNIHYLLDLNDL